MFRFLSRLFASWRVLLLVLVVLSARGPMAWAVEPDEILKDPALETRARHLSAQLRCMVCQNESIDESHADLARDLRLLVREQLVAGKSDEEIRRYLVARYGPFILLQPPFEPTTVLLWGTPLLILIGGGFVLWRAARNRSRGAAQTVTQVAPLDPAEQKRLDQLLGGQDGDAP